MAWAQPAASPAPTSGKWANATTWYTIKTGNGYYLRSDVLQAGEKLALTSSTRTTEDAGLWCFVGDSKNGYTFYNRATGPNAPLAMYDSEANAYALLAENPTDADTAFDFTQSKKSGGTWWCLKEHGSEKNYWNKRNDRLAYWNSTDAVNGWGNSGTGDDGSALLFEEVSIETFFEYADSEESIDTWYYMTINSNTKSYLHNNGTADVIVADKSTVDNNDKDAYTWAFIGNPFDGFVVKNKKTGYLNAGNDGAVIGENSQIFTVTKSSHGEGGFFMAAEGKDRFNRDGRSLKVVYWSDADAGSTFQVIEREPVAKIDDVYYWNLSDAVAAAQAGDEIVVIAEVADVTVDVTKNLTISGSVTLNNVGINANGADALTVKGLTFTGNSWINSGTAETLTVSGVTATVAPVNTSYTNSRSAFISLGRSEQQTLALTVKNCNITVTSSGPDAILGWAAITKATITDNVIKGSSNDYFANADAIKFMAIAPDAEFVIENNEIYSNYNGIVFAQNTTRDNAYSVSVDGNKFLGGADHIWIEISGGNTVHATVNATSANTVNGNAFTVNDIKYHSNVIKTWSSYAGVDVVTNDNGKVIGGTLASFSNKECIADGYELGTDGAVAKKSIAAIGENKYESLEAAVDAALLGDEIVMLADVTLDAATTLPAGITFNGNGKQINGTIIAAGDITFAGVTKAGDLDFAVGNTVVNIPAGASLQLNGSARMSIGFGTTFNIVGTIEDAKTADKATVVPSLVIPGASFSGAGVKFNVTNAYISVPSSYCSTSKTASGTFDFNITNSIWESAEKLAFEEQSVNAKVDFALVNSVLTTGSHLVFGTASGEEGVVIDNSYVNKGTSRQLENCGTMTIKNGSVVNGGVAKSSNAKNPGTIIVENATYAVTGEFSGSDLGTGTIIIKKGATVSAGSITNANITIDAAEMTEGELANFTANLSGLTGTLSVINNDKLEAKIVDGKIVLAAKPVAKIGEQGYATLEAAFAAATEGQTIVMLDDATPALTSQRAITKAAVIDLGGKTLKLIEDDLYFGTTTFQNGTIVVDPSVVVSTAVFWMFENQALTFDNVDIVATGVTGTYLIGINGGTGTAVNLVNGSSITIANETKAGLTAVICDNGTGNNVTIKNSEIDVNNIEGRFYLGGKNGAVVVENTDVDLNGVKEGFYLRAGQSLAVTGTTTVDITLNSAEGRYGINLTDLTATYTKAETATVNATLHEVTPAAVIGEKKFASLQAAVNAVQNGETITLTSDITEKVTVSQVANVSFVIDGQGKKFDGTIIVDGNSRNPAAETLTIQNVNFETSAKDRYFVDANDASVDNRYSHNVTIKNCNFTAVENSAAYHNAVAARFRQAYNIKIEGGVFTNMHSVLQAYGVIGVEVSGVKTVNSKNGVSFGTSQNAVLKNVEFDATGYGVRVDAEVNTTLTIENAKIDAFIPVVARKATANYNVTFNGTNTMTATNTDGIWFAAGASEYETNGTMPTTATGKVRVTLNDATLSKDGVYGDYVPVAKIGDVEYTSLEAAFKAATSGCTIEILENVTVDYAWDARYTGAKFTVPVTINGNGKTIKFTNTVYDGGNYMSAFRFEADATVNNLTVDMSEAQSGFQTRIRAISAKGNLAVDGCTFIGNGSANNTRAIIFGEGASTAENTIAITNSTFNGWRRGISDSESAKDVAANVTVTGNTLDDAAVYVSATESVTFTGNTVNANVDIRSYTADNTLNVTATDNTLAATEGVEYKIKAGGTINAQNDFVVPAKGSITPAYTGATSIWGEGGGNAKQSLVVKLYSNETLLATASLNNIGGIINGNVYVSWNIPLNSAGNDEYWTVEWSNPVTLTTLPTKVVMVVDGVEVAENNFQLNSPDDLNKIVAAATDADGKILSCHTSVANAVAANAQNIALLRNTEETIMLPNGVTLNTNGFTANNVTIPVASVNGVGYATLADAMAAAQAGDVVTVFAGTYAMPSMKAGITIVGEGEVVFEGTLTGTLENLTMKNIHIKGANAQRWAYAKGNLVFENVTFEATSVYALHFDGITEGANLTYKNCTIIGWAALGGSPASCVFDGCTFKGNGTYGVIRTYFDTEIKNSTFDVASVNTTDVYQDGIHAVEGANVTVTECTNANGDMKAIVNVEGSSVITVDGKAYKNVAQIGETKYITIEDAIAAWTNNTTLTLLADVTLSDVIKLSSTEYHVLDLGTYTMTAASRKNAIEIVNNGRSSASYTLDIKADATNPGGITATSATVVKTTGKSGVKDRPIIRFYNGVFNANNIIQHSGSNGTNSPQFIFYNGVYNGNISTNRAICIFEGGTFNGKFYMSVDSSSYARIGGGTFKYMDNLYGSALNSDKFTIGSAKGVFDRGVYVDDNGYVVVGGSVVTEAGETFEASSTNYSAAGSYLQYSSAKDNDLYYTAVEEALKDNSNKANAVVTVYADEVDMSGINYKGTIIVPVGETVTITNAPATPAFTVKSADGYVIEPNENGAYVSIALVAKIGDKVYDNFEDAVAAAQEGETVTVHKAGTYALKVKNNITITGAVAGVEFANIGAFGCNGANVTFNNVTFTYAENSTYKGLQHSGNLVYNNCTFNGQVFLYGQSETFNKCTFKTTDSNNYNVWTYGAKNVAFNECTFNSAGKSVLIYAESASVTNNVTVVKSQFNASQAVEGKAAIEMDSSLSGAISLTIDGETTATGFGTGNVSGNSLWNNKKGNNDVANNDITVKVGDTVVLAPIFEAQIGDVQYRNLQDAINAVQNDETITVLRDIAANVEIKEKDNVKVTIDGNGMKMTGAIKVVALSSDNDRRITIKNFKFEDTTSASVDFITSVETNHYPRITVEGCTFTGSGDATDVALRLKSSKNVEIKNCTGKGLHSFLQNTSGWNLTVENVTVTDSKSGLALGTVQGVTVKGCTVDVPGYGIRMDAGYNNNAVIESNTIKAFIPVVVRKATVNSNIAVNGTNNLTATNEDGLWMAIGTSEYEANGSMPTAATGRVKVAVNDAGLSAEGVYGDFVAVATIGEVEFDSLKAAFAAAQEDQTITILAGTYSEGTIKLPATLKNVTIKGAASAARSTEETILKDMTISAADGNSYSYIGLTFDGITFDNSRILLTGWRNGEETIEDLTVTNCTFKNLNDDTNSAPVHINKDAAEAVKNFTFTNNVIDGATGGSKSGIYAQVTGNVVVSGNVINNVSFRPYVIQVTTDDGVADNFTVTGNTFSGSAVGRAQGLGNNAEGTDNVNLVVSNNIFKGITDSQQICYWNFNAAKTTADLSKNYYDIDILANPSKIYYNSAAVSAVDLIAKKIFPIYTELKEDGTINTESAYSLNGGTWGGIDWTLIDGTLTIAPTKGTPVADKNAASRTYEVGEWREAVRYNASGEGVAIEGWPYDRSKVTKLIIEEGVTKIGSFAAQSMTNLTGEVVIPYTVKYIGHEAFQKSTFTKLTFANVPDGETGEELCIAQGAFKNLIIEEIAFPADRPVHLHAWVLNNCHNLKNVTFPATLVGVHGTNHIDYFKDFNAHSNPTWTKASEILAYNEKIETVTFESEEARDLFYSYDNNTSDKDYIVATVGLTSYGKIADAIAAVNENGGTIKMHGNVTLADTWTIPAGKTITLDLNGKTISQSKACTASYEMINNKGNLNIVGSGKISFTDTSAGDPSFGWGSYTVRNEGNLVVEKATIEHLGAQAFGTHCIMAIYQYCGSTTINGGTISTPNYRSARLWKGEMTINGGTFNGQVWVQAVDNTAKLTINGGTFEPNGGDASAVFVTNSDHDVQLAVTDGTFNGKIGCSDATKLAGAIKGGKFNEAAKNGTNAALLATGLAFGDFVNGYCAVEDDPATHYIATLEDLKAFRDEVNSGANYYAGVDVYLTADIDMAGENWVGIGSAAKDHGFMGNFDGQGYKIKNLTITDPALDSDGYAYAGLFGVTEGTDKNNQNTIKNLTIENVTINTTGHIVSAAIAYPYYTIVDNVKVCGNIAINGGDYTAGVLAYTRRCVNASNLSVVGNENSFVKGNKVVGGVISDIQTNGGLVADYKNFSAEGIKVSGAKSVGAISGIISGQNLNYATVKNVELNSQDGFAGIVAGRLGTASTVTNVSYENVTGAATLIGGGYDSAKAVQAKIGNTYYQTLDAALAAEGNEVELLAPVTIAKDETVVLDLNGKTVSYTSAVAGEDMITNRGNLTITDSSDAKTGKLAYVNTDTTASNVTVSTISTEAGSTLVVDGGTIENKTVKADGSSIYSFAIDILTNGNLGDVNVTINGGTVYSDYMAIRQFNNGTACKNSLTINGGYIYGAKRAVQVHMDNNAAVTAIIGGKVEAGEGGYAICNFAATSDLAVTGGEFIGAVYSARENFISGGIYDAEVYAGYCAEGYMPNKNVDGTYGVVAVADAYASIDGVTYGSLKAAINAAKAGETITLLQNVTENVTISKNLTIDGAGNTITGMITTDGKSLKVTIRNVNFDGNNKTVNYAMRADDDLNLLVENCTASNYIYGFLYANKSNDNIVVKNVTVDGCAEYGAYLVSFNNATFEDFTVKGNTKYGIAVANAGARTVNLKNVSFEDAETPLSINEIGTGKVTFNFSGINDMSKAEYYTSQYVNVVAAAQVGTNVCGSLQDAVVAANDGETVKVLADVNMTTANFVTQVDGYATLVNVQGKAVTIDLNGKKVTVNAADADLNGNKAKGNMLMSVFHADPNGTLTLTDSSAEGTGTVELFANDATVYALIVSENAYDKSNPGKIIINGGNYIADKLSDSMVFADINEVITVNGGNFHLDNVGEGPKGNGSPWIFNASGNNQMHINVNGGTYNANVAKQHWTYEVNLGEGLTTTNNGDGTWTVVPGVAAVGEELFGSIQEAIDAAQDGETVKLIADVALDTKKYTTQVDNLVVLFNVKGKAVIFDLNGKKIDVNASAANLGGKMLAGVFSADVEGDFTITDSSAEGTGAVNVAVNDAKVYSVFISENAGDKTKSGKMTVNAGNFTTVGKVANAMIYADTDKVVTINGGTFICDGVSASENYPWFVNTLGNNEMQVTVNGGTFNIDINHQYRPFEVFVPENLAVKANGDGTWTIVPAQAYVTELLGAYVNEPGSREHKVGYATVAEAIAAAEAGATVTILAGEYTQNLNVNKAITVKGEVDENGNNLVTFNGKLNITADGATVENLNFNNSGTAAYVGAKNVTIDGCSLVGSNGLYQSYTSGTVTFKNSYIKGGTYGIHFDGNAGGNIVIENCTVIGWTSFAGTINSVAISGTTFAEGNYNQLRLYQNATISDCTFNEKMNIDWGSSNKTAEFDNCSVEGDKELIEILSLSNIANKGLEVTIDGERVCVAAKVDSKYYMSLQEAINAATVGQTVTILSDITLTEGVTVAADKNIFIDLNGKTISMETAEAAVAALIKNNGTLTIESLVDGGKLSFLATAPSAANAYASNTISNYGTLTINAGTVENLSTGGACYALDNYAGSTVTINGGKLTAEKTAVRVFNWTNGEANAAELNVVGGEIISNDGYGININAGNAPYVALNISGGTITTNDTDYNLAVYVVNKNSAENFTANISGGTFNGNLALNGVTSTTMAKGNVSVSGGTFDGVICYDEPACQFITGGSYMTEFTEDYLVYGYQLEANAETALYDANWTGRREVVTIVDGEVTEFDNENDIEVGTLTYKRNVGTTWTPLYVPFEIPAEMLLSAGFEVGYITGVREADKDNDGEIDNLAMEIIQIKNSRAVLHANHPYFVRSKDQRKLLQVVLEDAALYSSVENTYDCRTMFTEYSITGNLSLRAGFTANDRGISAGNWEPFVDEYETLNPFRFYLTIAPRGNSPFDVLAVKSMSVVVRGEENENGTTTIYEVNAENGEEMIFDLSGRRVLETEKGIYIKDGKKVLVK